ncbi:MAG TPA: GGDEF domain-containing protein [Chroococcales cyanobacterium]
MSALSDFNQRFLYALEKTHKSVFIGLGIFFLILIGCIDYFVPPEIYLSIFYLLPIYSLTWFVGRKAGIIAALLSAIASSLTHLINEDRDSFILIIGFWNSCFNLSLFIILSTLFFELHHFIEEEQKQARIDKVTGLANKRLFFELAHLEIKKSHRYRHPLTIIYMDIDDFKKINEMLGRTIGDKLLKTVAETIKSNIRETDIIGRIGDDEFSILLPGSGYEPAQIVIFRVQSELLKVMQKNNWAINFSLGAVTFLSPPKSVEEMLQPADRLMYLVKNEGKNHLKHRTSV